MVIAMNVVNGHHINKQIECENFKPIKFNYDPRFHWPMCVRNENKCTSLLVFFFSLFIFLDRLNYYNDDNIYVYEHTHTHTVGNECVNYCKWHFHTRFFFLFV